MTTGSPNLPDGSRVVTSDRSRVALLVPALPGCEGRTRAACNTAAVRNDVTDSLRLWQGLPVMDEPTTSDLLNAWRDATRAAELAARLAKLAADTAQQTEVSAAAAEEIADLAERAADAAATAARRARAASDTARGLADAHRDLARAGATAGTEAVTAETRARDAYHHADEQVRERGA